MRQECNCRHVLKEELTGMWIMLGDERKGGQAMGRVSAEVDRRSGRSIASWLE